MVGSEETEPIEDYSDTEPLKKKKKSEEVRRTWDLERW